MRITLVRHTSVDVPPGVCYGKSDVLPAPTFPEEAAQVKRKLQGQFFPAVYCSPSTRCRRLAEVLTQMKPVCDNRLMEMDFGDWEGKYYDEITDPRLQEWYDDYIHLRATGGESFLDQQNRFKDFITDLKTAGKNDVLIVTHAGILMQALIFAGVPEDEVFRRKISFGEVIALEL